MKKTIIFFITVVLCLGMVACSDKKDTEKSTTTEPTIGAENPLGFDPNRIEDWMVEDLQEWSDWMTSEGLLISDSDHSIGDFSFGMTEQEAAKYYPSKPLKETEKPFEDILTRKTITFDPLILVFSRTNESDDVYALSSIEVDSTEYATPRGLRVGDDAKKVYELYGVPMNVKNNVWTYGDGNYDLFSATVVDGLVKKIHLFSTL